MTNQGLPAAAPFPLPGAFRPAPVCVAVVLAFGCRLGLGAAEQHHAHVLGDAGVHRQPQPVGDQPRGRCHHHAEPGHPAGAAGPAACRARSTTASSADFYARDSSANYAAEQPVREPGRRTRRAACLLRRQCLDFAAVRLGLRPAGRPARQRQRQQHRIRIADAVAERARAAVRAGGLRGPPDLDLQRQRRRQHRQYASPRRQREHRRERGRHRLVGGRQPVVQRLRGRPRHHGRPHHSAISYTFDRGLQRLRLRRLRAQRHPDRRADRTTRPGAAASPGSPTRAPSSACRPSSATSAAAGTSASATACGVRW